MKSIRHFMPHSWSLVLSAFAAAYGVGLITLLALPFLITAVMNDLQLNEAQAGFLMSAEFVFTMLASLFVAPIMGKAPRRTLTLIGTFVAILANMASAHIHDVYLLTMMRCVAGFGAGLALACGNACVSSAKDPDRTAGHMNVLFVALMIIVMLSYAKAMNALGLAGIYYAIALTMTVMLLFIIMMPQNAEPQVFHHKVVKNNNLVSTVAICMMIAMFLFSMRDTMGWAFVGQVGIDVGYNDHQLGMLFSLQALVGLVGPIIAAMVGRRFGMSVPIIIGILATGAVSLGYVLGEFSKTIYTISVMMIAATYFYTLAYLTGLAASLDEEGRIVAASSSFLTLGIAVGPAVSGQMVTYGGYALVGWGISGFILLTLLFVLVPLSKAKAHRQLEQRQLEEENNEIIAPSVL